MITKMGETAKSTRKLQKLEHHTHPLCIKIVREVFHTEVTSTLFKDACLAENNSSRIEYILSYSSFTI